jgi:hypothetical protein
MSSPAPNILEKKGHFMWLHSKNDGERVHGLISVDGNGLAILKLEGSLLGDEVPRGRPIKPEEIEVGNRSIVGQLSEDEVRIYLYDLSVLYVYRHSNGKIAENYRANYCLVGKSPNQNTFGPFLASRQSISLKGLEEWLRFAGIEVDFDTVDEKSIQQVAAPLDGGDSLVIRREISRIPQIDVKDFSNMAFAQQDWLDYIPSQPITVDQMKYQFAEIEEFLALLTGHYYYLEWPTLYSDDEESASYTLYFWRSLGVSSSPEMREIWIFFPQVRERLGSLFSAWREKKGKYGPGFYLYISNLRTPSLYIEHRFMNLVWGIESFHRNGFPNEQSDPKTKAMIDEVLMCVEKQALPKVHRWLQGKLKRGDEPNLQRRILDVLSTHGVGIDRKRLSRFAEICMHRRNEISHFGGAKTSEDRWRFLRAIQELDGALSHLYHAVLLQEIGLDHALLMKCFYQHPISWRIQPALERVGLVVKKGSEVAPAEKSHVAEEGTSIQPLSSD